jgi:hypothetical protein
MMFKGQNVHMRVWNSKTWQPSYMWLVGLYMLSISNHHHWNQITNGQVLQESEQLEKYQLLTIELLNPGSLKPCATSKQSTLT